MHRSVVSLSHAAMFGELQIAWNVVEQRLNLHELYP